MKFRKTWFVISGALSALGLVLAGFATKATAQWSQTYRTMHRGSIAQSIVNKGWGGHRDNGKKQEPHGFSYPAARNLKVYSGGWVRSGWNHKIHSAGDGQVHRPVGQGRAQGRARRSRVRRAADRDQW